MIVILQSKLKGLLIDIDFIFIYVRQNKKSYMMCYYPLNYDANFIFDMFDIKMSCIIVFSSNFESVLYWTFISHFLRQSKNDIKYNFQFQSTVRLEFSQFLLPISSKHQRAYQYKESADSDELYLEPEVNRLASGKLWKLITVSSQCEKFY